MLKPVAQGVLIHQSEKFMQSNAVVVQGKAGVLLIDPGITGNELEELAQDLQELGQPVVAGFSTHPHWDHLLWRPKLGQAPRYGTATCAAEAKAFLSNPDWRTNIAPLLPPDIAGEIPLDLLGEIAGLPEGATHIPWEGPKIRVIEHQAHAAGHAALLIEESGVLVAGDMLSDIFMPMLNMKSADPAGDYLAALQLLESVAAQVKVVIPGHGSVGEGEQMRARLKQDLAYVQTLCDGGVPDDPRVGPAATFGQGWLPGVHQRQLEQLARKGGAAGGAGK
jgi:glyoxylase-like metal-dependent hydrolase (beta-lactamase superfamily II)